MDPSFKDQFLLTQLTARFQALYDAIPEVVVLPASRLRRIVALLATETARCFTAQGLSTPPWRKLKSYLSKWQPAPRILSSRASLDFPAFIQNDTEEAEQAEAFSSRGATSKAIGIGGHSPGSPSSVLDRALSTEEGTHPVFFGFELNDGLRHQCVCCGLNQAKTRSLRRRSLAREGRWFGGSSAPAA